MGNYSTVRTMRAIFISLVLLLGFGITSQASHISGGSIKYKSLGNNLYYIEAAVFRDCNGAGYSSRTETVDAVCTSNSGAGWTVHTVSHLAFVAPTPAPFGGPYGGITVGTGTNALVAEEVSDVCDKLLDPSRSPSTKCRNRNNTAQGYMRFKFSAVITLSSCNWWRLGFSPVCCRNTGSSNTRSGGMYVHTFINTRDFPTNSAPDFADEVKPIPSACVGKKVYYGIGTIDYDGDSLRFELACAMQDSTRCVQYNTGFSALLPASKMFMDSVTGLLSFTPATAGKRVVAFWVKEYERCTGVLKAKTLRDVQFRVESCSNNVPRDVSGISNVQGKNYTLVDSFRMEVCNGEYITFEDTIVDIDSAAGKPDTLIFSSNYDKVLTGATMTVNYITKTKAVVKWSWRASIGINPVKIFYLVFNDDFCDYPGNGFSVFELNVRNSTNAGRDTAVCKGDTVHLNASGGKLYQWKSVYGDSLYYSGPKQNIWSDTTIADTNRTMKFLPSKTTLLEVWSDLQEGCIAAQACSVRDTIKIVAADPFELITTKDTTICYEDSTIQIETKPDSANFTYFYKWAPHSSISNDTISNPMVTPFTSRSYAVTVTSDTGCVRSDTMSVNVTLPLPRNIKATTLSDPTCVGVDAPITLEMGYSPIVCANTTDQCFSALVLNSSDSTTRTNTPGTSTSNTITDFPCPYGGNQSSARMQFIYTSAELLAMGVNAGVLDGLGFNVVAKRASSKFGNYTIKVGCTKQANFNSGRFIAGLTTVFTPKTVTISNGWNLHALDSNYALARGNNLVVEICYDNNGTTSTNAAVAFMPTTFQSCITSYGSTSQCGSSFLSLASAYNRPTIQLSYCGQRDSTEFTYKWTPSLGLNHDTLKNPTANIDTTTTFRVLITDTVGRCSDTASLKINIANIDAGPDTSMCPNDSIQLFPDVVTSCGGRGVFVWTPSQYFKDDSVRNAIVSVSKTTMITVTFHDSCGCALKDSLMVYADSVRVDPDMYNPDCAATNGRIKLNTLGGFGPFLYSIDSGRTFGAVDSFINQRIGFYAMQVVDSIGCASPIVIDTLFNDNAPQITSLIPKNVSCNGFSDGEIDVKTRASVGVTPFWYSVDSTTSWVRSSVIQNLAAGKYLVYAKGDSGCTSFPEKITLTEPDKLELDFETAEDTCFQLGNGWAKGIASGGTSPYVFTWSILPNVNGGHLPVLVGDTLMTKIYAEKTHNLNIIDDNGCILDTTFEIKERPELMFENVTITPTTCFGYADGKIAIKVSGGTKNYQFSIDSGKTYLDGSPLEADSMNFDTLVPGINSIKRGDYPVFVKDRYQCTISRIVTVLQPPLMETTTPQDSVRICVSTCAKLEVNSKGGNSPQHEYNWTPSLSLINVTNFCPLEKENLFTVYANDEKGCISNTIILKVDLFDSLKVQLPNDTSICDGAFVQLDAIAGGGDGNGYNYVWQPFANLSNAFIKNPVASPVSDINYALSVKDNCGSPEIIDSIEIKILPQPVVNFSADSLEGCPPFQAYFDNKTNDSYRCLWSFGDGTKAATCSEVSKVYSQSGKYNVKLNVTSKDGCIDSLEKKNYLNILPVPRANFSMEPQPTTILETELKFKDLSEGKVSLHEWNFASMDTSMKPNPKYQFPDVEKGKYPVKLIVTNIFGCVNDTIRNVLIDAEFFLYIPNSFTPNGDGKNDIWKPLASGFEYDYYEVQVFDRWGKMVFNTTDYEDGWDGTVNNAGEKAAVGVYTWRVAVGDAKNIKTLHEQFGTLTIIK
jgi:gliding motility-associated-like protein